MEVAFKHLSLGAKFSFLGHDRTIFVKLSDEDCVKWDDHEPIVCYNKQVVMWFGDVNKLVDLREIHSDRTYHEFPKTAYKEGYDHYVVHPRWSDNPYTKGSQEFLDFQRGYLDADWEDTI